MGKRGGGGDSIVRATCYKSLSAVVLPKKKKGTPESSTWLSIFQGDWVARRQVDLAFSCLQTPRLLRTATRSTARYQGSAQRPCGPWTVRRYEAKIARLVVIR